MSAIRFVNPHKLFITEPPHLPIVSNSQYYDKTAIGMSNYLEILASVGLYGFQFAVKVNNCGKVLDGNFRTYAAIELGLPLPINIQKWMHVYPVWIIRIIRRFRLLFKRNSLFYKTFKTNSNVNCKSLFSSWQYNIFINEQLNLPLHSLNNSIRTSF